MTDLFPMTAPNLVSLKNDEGTPLSPAYRVFDVCGIYPIDEDNKPEHIGEAFVEENGEIRVFFQGGKWLTVREETMFILRPYPKAA